MVRGDLDYEGSQQALNDIAETCGISHNDYVESTPSAIIDILEDEHWDLNTRT